MTIHFLKTQAIFKICYVATKTEALFELWNNLLYHGLRRYTLEFAETVRQTGIYFIGINFKIVCSYPAQYFPTQYLSRISISGGDECLYCIGREIIFFPYFSCHQKCNVRSSGFFHVPFTVTFQ